MGLLDDLKANTATPPWQICGVKWALQTAQGGDRDALAAAVDASSGVSAVQIARAVEKHLGIRLGLDAVRRHRRGACRCEP